MLKYFKALKRNKIITCLKLAKKRATCQTHETITDDFFSPEALTQQKNSHCVWVELSWPFGKNGESCKAHSKLRHSYSLFSEEEVGGGWPSVPEGGEQKQGTRFRELVGIIETSFK